MYVVNSICWKIFIDKSGGWTIQVKNMDFFQKFWKFMKNPRGVINYNAEVQLCLFSDKYCHTDC